MILTLSLAVLIGVSLGLLGGGGTILTVPILLYAAELEPKQAIATSLLVVALASIAGVIQHHKRVDWRTGALFGAAGMAGAYFGGRVAALISGEIILLLFAVIMVVTGVFMLRKPRVIAAASPQKKRPILRIVAEGTAVGAVTGLVGAGGGFLVVPALALLGGLEMKTAVATSLLVIAMKSLAGFGGYLGHVQIDWTLALSVSGAAIVGSIAGARLSRLVSAAHLRKVFAVLVLIMALVMIVQQLPAAIGGAPWFNALFVERWPWWAGGAAIAAIALGLLIFQNQPLGVSTGCAELGDLATLRKSGPSWRVRFIAGIAGGGLIAGILAGNAPTFAMSALDGLFASGWYKVPLLLLAGVLIGFGSRAAGGCTSGHSIVGVAQGARSSLVATMLFLAGGFVATQLLYWAIGGLS